MNFPEYLVLFSNKGTIDVQVNFKDHDRSISTRKMSPKEISVLISKNGKGFHKHMTIDDCLLMVTKYEIDPAENKLTIFVSEVL